MELRFTPELEAKLIDAAAERAVTVDELVCEILERHFDFLAAVQEGIAAADRGEFIEEEEMDARFERMLKQE